PRFCTGTENFSSGQESRRVLVQPSTPIDRHCQGPSKLPVQASLSWSSSSSLAPCRHHHHHPCLWVSSTRLSNPVWVSLNRLLEWVSFSVCLPWVSWAMCRQ